MPKNILTIIQHSLDLTTCHLDFFLMEFFSNQVQNHVRRAHGGDEPKLLEEDAVLPLNRGSREPGAEFQVPDRAHRKLSKTQTHGGRNTGGETSTARVSATRFPLQTHSPPTSKLSRYDSGVVIDTQSHVNCSKIGNKDKD